MGHNKSTMENVLNAVVDIDMENEITKDSVLKSP